MIDYANARHNMVESQLRPNKVTDERVIAAFAELPRERFLPKSLRGIAYVDEDIPLAPGRYLMEPMVMARLIQAAQIKPADVVLDVGCGIGYSTAVLARLASTVVAIESDPGLAREATRILGELGIDQAVVLEAPLESGYPRQAPYDVIFIGGAVERLRSDITDQLAEGGRLVAVIDDPDRRGPGQIGRATLMVRRSGVVSSRVVFDAGTPLLPGFAAEPGFVF
jgi:protein-L-isoaspartate(D-aspartate) O-methyltransferase